MSLWDDDDDDDYINNKPDRITSTVSSLWDDSPARKPVSLWDDDEDDKNLDGTLSIHEKTAAFANSENEDANNFRKVNTEANPKVETDLFGPESEVDYKKLYEHQCQYVNKLQKRIKALEFQLGISSDSPQLFDDDDGIVKEDKSALGKSVSSHASEEELFKTEREHEWARLAQEERERKIKAKNKKLQMSRQGGRSLSRRITQSQKGQSKASSSSSVEVVSNVGKVGSVVAAAELACVESNSSNIIDSAQMSVASQQLSAPRRRMSQSKYDKWESSDESDGSDFSSDILEDTNIDNFCTVSNNTASAAAPTGMGLCHSAGNVSHKQQAENSGSQDEEIEAAIEMTVYEWASGKSIFQLLHTIRQVFHGYIPDLGSPLFSSLPALTNSVFIAPN